MPPKTTTAKPRTKKASAAAAPATPPVKISTGAGITAGLELWKQSPTGPFFLVDTTPDGRFATDVATWNAAAGLVA
jgi:hypothetical protein